MKSFLRGDHLSMAQKDIYPHANTVVAIEDSKLLKQFQYEILLMKIGQKSKQNTENAGFLI